MTATTGFVVAFALYLLSRRMLQLTALAVSSSALAGSALVYMGQDVSTVGAR